MEDGEYEEAGGEVFCSNYSVAGGATRAESSVTRFDPPQIRGWVPAPVRDGADGTPRLNEKSQEVTRRNVPPLVLSRLFRGSSLLPT